MNGVETLRLDRQTEQDRQQLPVVGGAPERPQRWLDRPPGPWVAAVAAWSLGIAAAVFQFVQGITLDPNLYSWFLAIFSTIVGIALIAFAIRVIKEDSTGKFFVLLGAVAPLLFGSASFGFLLRDTTQGAISSKVVSVAITEPARDQLVEHHITVKGVVDNKPPGKQIWIAVTGQMNNVNIPYQFYVKGNIQGGPCTVADNSFECDGIFVGVPQDTNKYQLIPVVADESQAAGFQQCMKDVASQVVCANVRPDGIQLGAAVFIKRQ